MTKSTFFKKDASLIKDWGSCHVVTEGAADCKAVSSKVAISRKTSSVKTIIIAFALIMLAAFPANTATIEEFQTEEYYGSGGLDLINAAESYSKGYTGKDITIGINDELVNLEHSKFEFKTGSKYIGSLSLEGIDWVKNDHGTHVAGIAAAAKYHGRSGIIGYDLKLTDTKSFGLFFGHGNNTLDGFKDAWAKNKIEENKFGFYASRKYDKASGYLYLDYGKIDNELNRTLTNLDLSTNVKYKGNLFEIGGEYKLTPNNQKNKSWKVYPYINLQFSKYKQDGYHENGGGIFNQVVESKTNNYSAGQLGLEFNFSNEKENYVLRLAGKTAFSGYEPKLTYSFEGDMAHRLSDGNFVLDGRSNDMIKI